MHKLERGCVIKGVRFKYSKRKIGVNKKGMMGMKLKIAILGLNFGRNMIHDILHGEASIFFELAAVCDLEREKADLEAAKLGVKAYYDIDSLLENNDIKVIGLFTGPVGRSDLIRKIIRSGKDIITTKPFDLDSEKAMEVLNEAKNLRRVIHINSPSPVLSDELLQVKKWQSEYVLGQPVGCRCDVWASYREKSDGNWYDDAELCPAAPIFRLGIYLINDLVRLFGRAEQVQVLTSRIQTGRPTPDNAQLGILFRSGAIANIFASFCVNDKQFYKNSMIINYQNGTVYKNIDPRSMFSPVQGSKVSLVVPENDNNSKIITKEFLSHSGSYQWENLHKALHGEKLKGEVEAWEVVEGLRIIQAMSRGEKSGMTEYVSLQGEGK